VHGTQPPFASSARSCECQPSQLSGKIHLLTGLVVAACGGSAGCASPAPPGRSKEMLGAKQQLQLDHALTRRARYDLSEKSRFERSLQSATERCVSTLAESM
jgi:hypothetical protein